MSYQSKGKAEIAAAKLLGRMKGAGWKSRVWENMGWHIEVMSGPVSVYESYCPDKYHCLVSDDKRYPGTGAGHWTWTNNGPSRSDPNLAARDSVMVMLGRMKRYDKVREAGLRAIGGADMKLTKKRRDSMINCIQAYDICAVVDDAYANDFDYLVSILSGAGWTQYRNMSDNVLMDEWTQGEYGGPSKRLIVTRSPTYKRSLYVKKLWDDNIKRL